MRCNNKQQIVVENTFPKVGCCKRKHGSMMSRWKRRNTKRFYYAEPLLRPKTLSMRAGCGKKIHKTINVLFACVVAHDSPSNILLMLWEGGWEWA